MPSNKIGSEVLIIEKKDSKAPDTFPQNVDIRIQILKVFDLIKKASPLKTIQDEYDRLNGNHYPVRDTMRGLQNSKLIVMINQKSFKRGHSWVKSDWIENGQLKDEFKPDGFDLLYKPDDLVFQ